MNENWLAIFLGPACQARKDQEITLSEKETLKQVKRQILHIIFTVLFVTRIKR